MFIPGKSYGVGYGRWQVDGKISRLVGFGFTCAGFCSDGIIADLFFRATAQWRAVPVCGDEHK